MLEHLRGVLQEASSYDTTPRSFHLDQLLLTPKAVASKTEELSRLRLLHAAQLPVLRAAWADAMALLEKLEQLVGAAGGVAHAALLRKASDCIVRCTPPADGEGGSDGEDEGGALLQQAEAALEAARRRPPRLRLSCRRWRCHLTNEGDAARPGGAPGRRRAVAREPTGSRSL